MMQRLYPSTLVRLCTTSNGKITALHRWEKSGGEVNIYMDESGSFVHASTLGAWNAVTALATTEHADEEIHHHLAQLKLSNGLDPVWFDLNHGFLPDFDDSFKKYKIYSSLLNISEGHSIS